MTPPPVDRCRVLELGCAMGANLIPMAVGLPDSEFVGYDLSARQIEEARAVVKRLGISNIQLEHRSILDVGEEVGRFDYIIAHGVYSWVPDAVREKILAICRERLAQNGVAYVSYNTYPGWHWRGMIADMMRYHVKQFQEPRMRIAQARALLDFLVQSVPAKSSDAYSILLKAELEMLRGQADWYLFHDHLEEVNDPVYFHQFVERAAAHGLQYLGEADFSAMLTSGFAPQVGETLRKVAPDIIRMEQYLDFLRNRTFRQTVLCHQGQQLVRDLTPEVLKRFSITSPVQSVSASPDVLSSAAEQFRTPNGATLTTGNPITKAAMMVLRKQWPQLLAFEELCVASRALLYPGKSLQDPGMVTRADQVLAAELLQCYTVNLIALHRHLPPCVGEVSERPSVSPLVQVQAERGPSVVNQRHETIRLDEFSRYTVRYLDGHHDYRGLLEELSKLVAQGTLVAQENGAPVKSPERIRGAVKEALDKCLPSLARLALLIA
jgi:methyltransferase-like protein/cyclopropane fatty-acyl-phospholipid synthase-like methyltransferase